MIRSVILAIVLTTACRAEPLWHLVAESPIIAVGTLRVPIDKIEAARAASKREYAELRLETTEFLRGSAEAVTLIRWYLEDRPYAPTLADLSEANGKTVVAFLVRAGEGSVHGVYFAGGTRKSLALATAATVAAIKAEIADQRSLLGKYPAGLPAVPEWQLNVVRRLLDETTIAGRSEAAFEQLVRLGHNGVPAMIALMDDRRIVAAEWLALKNPPGHWEAYRLYKPKIVADALDGILRQITGTGFFSIANGASDENRRATVDGWRIYLYHPRGGGGLNGGGQ